MKSIRNLQDVPAAVPLLADDLIEFHAARLLLLLDLSGRNGKVDGLTKLAKLDFFVRYPQFFREAEEYLGGVSDAPNELSSVESSMIRHNYGPWDKRYYEILVYLESRNLIDISKIKNSYRFKLTELGKQRAEDLAKREQFGTLAEHMKKVKAVFGRQTGNYLKKLIYQVFDKEIAQKPHGEVIG